MTKQARQFAIKEIVSTHRISSQGDLRRELRKQGWSVTQATLSRDLKELGMGKVATGEMQQYVLQPAGETQILRPLIGAQVLAIDANESLIIVRTLPGSASVVGEYVDSLHQPEILGTLAGDNVLLVIPQSGKKIRSILKFLKQKFTEGER